MSAPPRFKLPNIHTVFKNHITARPLESRARVLFPFVKFNMQSWPEHLLTLINSAAAITALVGAILLVISLGLLYFSGNELTRRAADKNLSPEEQTGRK